MSTRRAAGLVLAVLLFAPGISGQSYTLAPYARQLFLDNTGAPCSGCKLYTYAAGTSTPLDTYSDTAGTVNPNPIVMNAAGRPAVSGSEVGIYLSASSYKFVLKTSADVTLWTQDNISAVGSTAIDAATYAVVTTTATGTQNDFDPGIDPDGRPTLIITNNASNLIITGFPAGEDGQQILIINENSSVQYVIQDAGSGADNRLAANVDAGTYLTATFGTQLWVYSTVLDAWHLAVWNGGSDSGVTYSAGDYTATGGGSFTVAAGDLTRYRWELLQQYEVHVNLEIDDATISGTVSAANVALPFQSDRSAKVPCMVHDNSTTTYVIGVGTLTADSSTLAISLAGNWAASADNTDIYCNFVYKVH